jgi:lysozyme
MSDALRKLIKRHEGCSLIPYRCPAGKRTIGWGHNFDANPLPPAMGAYLRRNGSITVEMAEQLLEDDIATAITGVKSLLPDFDSYSENRQNALVSMCFQMGIGTLSKFTTTLRMIRDGDWVSAAGNLLLSKWAKKDTPKRALEVIELLRRG